jgi:hypothetical protein
MRYGVRVLVYICFKNMKIIQLLNENNAFALWLALCNINITEN